LQHRAAAQAGFQKIGHGKFLSRFEKLKTKKASSRGTPLDLQRCASGDAFVRLQRFQSAVGPEPVAHPFE